MESRMSGSGTMQKRSVASASGTGKKPGPGGRVRVKKLMPSHGKNGLVRYRIMGNKPSRIVVLGQGARVSPGETWRTVKTVRVDGKPLVIPNVQHGLHDVIVHGHMKAGSGESKSDREKNTYLFYTDRRSLAGMDEGNWPPALREALDAEMEVVAEFLAARSRQNRTGGTFLEIGSGTGRALAHVAVRDGQAITLSGGYDAIIGMDYSIHALRESVRRVSWIGPEANRILGSTGLPPVDAYELSSSALRKSRFVWEDARRLPSCGVTDVCTAAILFNTLANMEGKVAVEVLGNLGRVMKRHDVGRRVIPVAFITGYLQCPKTIEMQRQFYSRMGLEITRIGRRHAYAQLDSGGELVSKRFTPAEFRERLEAGGMYVLSLIKIAKTMLAAFVIPLKETGPGDRNEERGFLDKHRPRILSTTGIDGIEDKWPKCGEGEKI